MYKVILLFSAVVYGAGVQAQALPEREYGKNAAPLENSLEYIRQLEPQVYELPGGRQHGFEVEDVERILPEAVSVKHRRRPAGKNNYRMTAEKEVDLERLVPLLVAAVREQQAEIEQLKKQVAEGASRATCGSCGKSCG